MRRRLDELLPLELDIIIAGCRLNAADPLGFYGFAIAQAIATDQSTRLLTAHGTLYKALRRLESRGYLESWWEDPDRGLEEGRPRRRLYKVTAKGVSSVAIAGTTIDDFHGGEQPAPA